MTYEDKLNRLERIAKLLIGAGLRMRRHITKLEGKIDVLISTQIQFEDQVAISRRDHDEKMADVDEKIAVMIDAQIRHDEQLAQMRHEQEKQLARSRRDQEEKISATRHELNIQIANLFKAQTRTEEQFAALVVSQRQTDHKVNALIDSLRRHPGGEATS